MEATYRGCEDVPTAHVTTLHYPVFSYEHRGRPYRGRSIQSVSGRRAREMSASGTYPIYLDPRQPTAFITRRGVGVMTIIELLCALGVDYRGIAAPYIGPQLYSAPPDRRVG